MNKKPIKSRLIIISGLLLAAAVLGSGQPLKRDAPAQFELRCGWFSNPTPANASLYDSEDEWVIGVQGGHQAEGDWPSFGPKQWVRTNGNYGHGCACLRVRVDRETQRVIEIESARARPLSACRRDRKLRRWDFK